MSDHLELRFLGVGNAAAHDLGNASSVLEDAQGAPLLLIDCGASFESPAGEISNPPPHGG